MAMQDTVSWKYLLVSCGLLFQRGVNDFDLEILNKLEMAYIYIYIYIQVRRCQTKHISATFLLVDQPVCGWDT